MSSIISVIVHFIAMMGIMISSFYVFMKSIHYTASIWHKVTIVVWCLLWSFLYGATPFLIPTLLFRPLACLSSVIFVFFLIKQKLEVVVSSYLLSFGISLFLHYIATFFIGVFSMFLFSSEYFADASIDYNKPIYLLLYTLVAILQIVLAILFFHIRRFRKGFPFIFKKITIVVSLILTGIILLLVTWVSMNSKLEENVLIGYLYIIGVLISGIGIYILIRRLIKSFQRKRAQQNAAEHFEKLWLEEKEDKAQALETIKTQSSIIHNFADRIQIMENNALEQGNIALLEDVQQLKKDLQNKMSSRKGMKLLQSTNNRTIDKLFERFAKQFADDNIDFHIMINGSIKYMVDNVIEQGELETLIVNHLKDAQIAVNASDNPFRRIAVTMGLSGDFYEFNVFDSGIPFEVDTLVQLGTKRITTHADTGGSGIGFETTFETMRKYSASLIINEQEQSKTDYSKSVSVRFDGKNQYIIETCRPNDFPASERYTVIAC